MKTKRVFTQKEKDILGAMLMMFRVKLHSYIACVNYYKEKKISEESLQNSFDNLQEWRVQYKIIKRLVCRD